MLDVSIIIPCKNEESTIGRLVDDLIKQNFAKEIIVVNDGSTDQTEEILASRNIKVITHAYSMGNGASIKSGARIASGNTLLFMDADGQHNVKELQNIIAPLENGYDMVVGARDYNSQASTARFVGNALYNSLASLITGHKIFDLTSGFRACKREYFLEFLSLLPNGFSYPTTITMAFFRTGHTVKYIPIKVNKREGKGHLSIIKDGIRFLMIIFKVGTLYSPLKLFAPLAATIFCSGLGYYIYTYFAFSRFTNMSLFLFITSVFVFIFGLISEQITMLIYLGIQKNNRKQ